MSDSNEADIASVAATPRKARAFGGYAFLVAAGILLSRIAGLIRERVFAHYFGSGDAAGAFKAALRIPNLLQNLLGEGVLSASFIPVYAKLIAEDQKELAGRVAGAVLAFLSLIVSIVVLIGVLFTPLIIDLVAPGFEGNVRLLTIRLVRILFVATGLLVLYAWCLGILNSHHKFFLSYVAPVLWNVAMIATMIFFGKKLDLDSLAVALAWGTVVGAILQFGIQVPWVIRFAPRIRPILDTKIDAVRTVFRNMGPVAVSRGVVQLSGYIDMFIASWLGTLAVADLGYAQTIYLLPISLFGMSVAASELPQMSSTIGSSEEIHAALRKRVDRALRQIAFFVIPSVVALLVIGDLLVAALYQTGRFGPEETRLVWYILVGSTIGLLAATLGRLYNSSFYALRDTRTPLKFAIVRLFLTGGLGYLFAMPLRPMMIEAMTSLHIPLPRIPGTGLAIGAIGLTASAGVAGWVEFYLLRRAMNRRIGETALPLAYQWKLWSAALIGALIARVVDTYVAHGVIARLHFLPHILSAIVAASLFGVFYFAIAMLLGVSEARGAIGRFIPAMRR